MREIKTEGPFEAQVVLQIENRAFVKGVPFYLLRRTDGFYGLAQQIGKVWQMQSPWIDLDAAAETALRVAGGDSRLITHPQSLRVLAVGVLAFFAITAKQKPEDGAAPETAGAPAKPETMQ